MHSFLLLISVDLCTIHFIPSALVLRIICCVSQKGVFLFLHTVLLYTLV